MTASACCGFANACLERHRKSIQSYYMRFFQGSGTSGLGGLLRPRPAPIAFIEDKGGACAEECEGFIPQGLWRLLRCLAASSWDLFSSGVCTKGD